MPNNSLRIIFAGTPDFSVPALNALIDSQHDVVAVYTQPDRPAGRGRKYKASPVKEVALQNNIPVYQPATLKEKPEQEQIAQLKPDVMVVVAYGLLLPEAVLSIPRLGCLNIHASLLPRWRGAAPIQRAILEGDKESGVCIMQMDIGLDTGDVLAVVTCPIDKNETGGSLHDKLATAGTQPLLDVLEQLQNNSANPVKQDNDAACYAKKLSKEEALIDWGSSAVEIDKKIRAFNPWPVAFTKLDDKNMRIWSATVLDGNSDKKAGTVLNSNKDGIDIATGQGILRITQLQMPGGRAMSASEFINAHNIADTVLG
ncbi:MAG: methionyl-tRNA formyltransferase [Gammaproteobacteria bacterium]|nr:methionyl-tRNA formyltransferase [Gammaproteobacteria bacterium]